MGVKDFRVVPIDLRAIGGSALTADIAVPKDRPETEMGARHPGDVRAGAQHALPRAGAGAGRGAWAPTDIFIGVNAVDYSGYPDCRPEFIRAFEALAQPRPPRRAWRARASRSTRRCRG